MLEAFAFSSFLAINDGDQDLREHFLDGTVLKM